MLLCLIVFVGAEIRFWLYLLFYRRMSLRGGICQVPG